MSVPLVDMHEWISRRLGHSEARYQQLTNGRPGISDPGFEHDIDCMAGIKTVLETVNADPRVFDYLKRKGIVA